MMLFDLKLHSASDIVDSLSSLLYGVKKNPDEHQNCINSKLGEIKKNELPEFLISSATWFMVKVRF